MMRKAFFSALLILPGCLLIFGVHAAKAQGSGGKIHFPDLPGYHTLLCDFHMHSVFSDGLVWPDVRIDEAINDGLDAIALTDHIEYRPHSDDLKGDHNRSWEIIIAGLGDRDLILVRGAEITRSMPPGHFNAFFISDANALDTPEWKDALRAAVEQGAFIVWNHPGWRQAGEIPIWYDEHSWLLEQGWLQGLEIVNENSYYPLAFQWAIDSNLCILGNSDIHDPVDLFFDKCDGQHRPVTLAFTTERSAAAIREAMDKRLTAVYYKDMLIGSEDLLLPLFQASMQLRFEADQAGAGSRALVLENKCSMPFRVKHYNESGELLGELFFNAMASNEISQESIQPGGYWIIENIIVAPGSSLILKL